MIMFSVVDEFENGYFYRLNLFMRNDQGSGFLVVEGLREGTKYKNLSDGIIISEDALKVSIFTAIREV